MTRRDDLDDLLERLAEIIDQSGLHEIEVSSVLGVLLATSSLNSPLTLLSQMTSFMGSYAKTITANQKDARFDDTSEI